MAGQKRMVLHYQQLERTLVASQAAESEPKLLGTAAARTKKEAVRLRLGSLVMGQA